jgi:predicted transcriptional regulator
MLSQTGPIGEFNDPGSLFSPERSKAECLWFNYGSISYNFPTSYLHNREVSEISFTFEICSETPYFNNNWPSDITVSVNSFELLTFTSPGDFGGKRGKYTPEFWPVISTQFGLLKKIRINSNGVFLDEVLINDSITFDKLNLLSENSIEFSLAVKKDAVHCGGMNLFGANFGNYPQHIIMGIR